METDDVCVLDAMFARIAVGMLRTPRYDTNQ